MKQLPISIGILSWNNPQTLENTLYSYKRNGLLGISDDIKILFQEASPRDIEIAKKYGVETIALDENIGIGKAIIKLIEGAKYPIFLFLENDWELVEHQDQANTQMEGGLQLLEKGFDVIRFRSRKKPGHPLFSIAHKGNELDYFDDWHQVTSPHLLESLHWLDPAESFPDKIQKEGDFFVTTSRWANWTNNPFLIRKDFYLEKIVPFAGEGVEFERKIAPWWVKQDFKIAQGEGLFMHNDLKKYPKPSIWKKMKRRMKKFLNT